jgi:hypothetical protein
MGIFVSLFHLCLTSHLFRFRCTHSVMCNHWYSLYACFLGVLFRTIFMIFMMMFFAGRTNSLSFHDWVNTHRSVIWKSKTSSDFISSKKTESPEVSKMTKWIDQNYMAVFFLVGLYQYPIWHIPSCFLAYNVLGLSYWLSSASNYFFWQYPQLLSQ